MGQILNRINRLGLSSTIIAGCLILGGFYYATQVNRQKSIERQGSFNNCMRSYSSEMEKFLNNELRLSPVDLCNKDYDYSSFINIGREAREEARSQYADPDNYQIQDQINNDISNRIREKLNIPKLVQYD